MKDLRRAMRHNERMGDRRYIRASELKGFAFCHRAWFLERQGAESTIASEQARGRADHASHGRAVQKAAASSRLAALFFLLGLAGIVAATLHWWFSR